VIFVAHRAQASIIFFLNKLLIRSMMEILHAGEIIAGLCNIRVFIHITFPSCFVSIK